MICARRLRGAFVVAGLWLAAGGALAGPGYLVRVQLEPGVSAADFAGYRRAALQTLEEQASRYASWHHRPERREAARRAQCN
ncbi:MAG TPA: hypothetical protein PKE47_15310, partial [Verrucomicrobiota bacterium]|nr:hypothetical protein [Verrucomicrobiota bacterium]